MTGTAITITESGIPTLEICTMNNYARHPRFTITAALLFWVAVYASVSAQPPSPSPPGGKGGAPINAICPVTTDEEIDPRFTALYQGQTIGLCCKKCLRTFEDDPDAYIVNLPESQIAAIPKADKANDTTEHDDHGEHAHGDNDAVVATAAEPAHDDDSHEHEPSSADDAVEAAEHDHATDHDDSRPRILTWLGKFHPPSTDLPIGVLLGAALAEGLFIVSKREMFRSAAAFCVLLAAVGAATAVPLGWFNAGFALVDDDWVQTTHRWLGTSTALLTLLTLVLLISSSRSEKPSARLRFRVALFASAGLVGVTGFFGGALGYGIDHYAW
ncbi:MAG: hypothetical protein H6813_02515 [Phycisphaeraceae bacterium]|nr:hypothetical protein [Phycisphaeraceae bacterium]